MNVKGIAALLLLAAASLSADESPTVDLFAGWSWYPYPYAYPYGPWWRDGYACGPYLGVSRAWPYPEEPWGYRYGYSPYPYYWGYGSGVRIKLKPGNPIRFPDPKDVLLPPFPGSAPTSLRDEAQEKSWDPDIESLLATLPTAAERLSSTNVPATR